MEEQEENQYLSRISRVAGSYLFIIYHFPSGSDSQESVCNAGNPGSIPGSGISPGEGNGNRLQYSCLENSMDRESDGLQSMGLKPQHNYLALC